MESTVQPERNWMDARSMVPAASSTGLRMTPPPMPQIAPTTQARKETRKRNMAPQPRFAAGARPGRWFWLRSRSLCSLGSSISDLLTP